MKKTWMNPELEALNLNETAFGGENPENFDGTYVEQLDADGKVIGYWWPAGAANNLSTNN